MESLYIKPELCTLMGAITIEVYDIVGDVGIELDAVDATLPVTVYLNPEKATKLRDWLTEWLCQEEAKND